MSQDLATKTRKGGQSANRYARLREEQEAAYVKKCCELATQHFITADRPNVKGLVFAGSAHLKTDMHNSEHFDKRLRPIVLCTVDVSYGEDQGFNQAITLAQGALSSV